MDDQIIIQHYWDRNEIALTETSEKYGSYCSSIAENIVNNAEDAQECVNDTYLKVWNEIPPKWPKVFQAFLGKIVRNLAYDCYRRKNAEKCGGGQICAVFDELAECLPDKSAEIECERKELSLALNSFLLELPERNRKIMVMRYWYADSIKTIALTMNMTENSVAAVLNRLRQKLQKYLNERGFRL